MHTLSYKQNAKLHFLHNSNIHTRTHKHIHAYTYHIHTLRVYIIGVVRGSTLF